MQELIFWKPLKFLLILQILTISSFADDTLNQVTAEPSNVKEYMKNSLLAKNYHLKLEEYDSSETVLSIQLLQNWNYTDLISSKLSCTLFPLQHLDLRNCSKFLIFLQPVCALFCLAFINTCCYDQLFIKSTFICITFEYNATSFFCLFYIDETF